MVPYVCLAGHASAAKHVFRQESDRSEHTAPDAGGKQRPTGRNQGATR